MLANKCIQFKNSADSQGLYFYGDIVSDEMDKWTDTDTCPTDVQNILNQIDTNKPLDIFINSGGGSVFAGLAIYNMLKRSPCNKTVHIDGLAGSISSVIAMAGDKIVMPSNAFLMIHKPSCDIAGNANDIRKMADDLDRIQEGILNVYAEKLSKDCSIDTIKQMVDNETWIVGSEANKYFNVEVIQSNKAVASVSNLNNYKHVPDAFNQISTIEPETEDNECACENCSHADNCQSTGAKCCICSNCTMCSQCSKPGANGCQCSNCTMAQNNCCQANEGSCLCDKCSCMDCKKGKMNSTNSTNSDMPMNKTIELLKAKLKLELL